MKTRRLGATGMWVSEISLGGLFLGRLGGGRDVSATLNMAADLGINLLDTAPAYQGSEEALGEAMTPALRKRFIIATKWWAYQEGGKDLDTQPASLRANVEASLTRLKTDHIDIFLFHSVTQPGDIDKLSQAPLQAELGRLKAEGKIRHVGLSNEGKDDPKDQRLFEAADSGLFEVAMPEFLIFRQGPAQGLLERCAKAGMGVISITPLGQAAWGLGLRDKKTLLASMDLFIKQGKLPDEARYRDDTVLDFLLDEQTPDLAAAALRFCLSFPGISSVCCGSNDPGHIRANAAQSAAGPYDAERLARVRELFGSLDAIPR
ncbi:MAG: aldo/keto reductase [candidate division FCPU426 bacterium]